MDLRPFLNSVYSDCKTSAAVISGDNTYLAEVETIADRLPILYAINLELQPELTVAEAFMAMLEDERIEAVIIFIDQVKDAAELSQAAFIAVRKGVPVIVVRGGRSLAAQRISSGASTDSSAQHANENAAVTALFDRLGFIECETLDEAVETLKMFIYGGRPLGRRIALSSETRAHGVLAADIATSVGLDVPILDESVASYLKPLMPAGHYPDNPLCLTQMSENQLQIVKSFLAGSSDMAVQVIGYSVNNDEGDQESEALTRTLEMVDAFANEAVGMSMPSALINTTTKPLPQKVWDMATAKNMVPLSGFQNGFRAIINTVRYVEQMILMAQMPRGAIVLPEVSNLALGTQLDEVEGKRRLYKAGLTVPKATVIEGSQGVDLSELTFPVVLKAVSADLTHKSELGAVKLDIHSEEQLRQTLFSMNDMLDSVNLRGFLIEEMVTDGIGELLVGVRHVVGIGQVLTLAFGGMMVELLGDVQTLVLPVSSSEIEQILRRLRLFPTINGWRGKPAADIDSVVESIALISNYAQTQRDSLFALEINPLIIRPEGFNPVVADAVFQLSE